jgi:antitoxin VapB
MALNIKHPDADRLARQLATRTGESLTDAVLNALRERLLREDARQRAPTLQRELAKIRERCSALPVMDPRTADAIIGYDDHGLPR